jgi:hypothetical protein
MKRQRVVQRLDRVTDGLGVEEVQQDRLTTGVRSDMVLVAQREARRYRSISRPVAGKRRVVVTHVGQSQ